MKRVLARISCLIFSVFFLAGTLSAAPKKVDITLAEVLESCLQEGTTFYPEYRDEINPTKKRPDKIIGKWSWESAEKSDMTEFPSDKTPWTDKGKIEKLIASMDEFFKGDPKTTKAAPAAADFPGVPEGDVDLVERQIVIDPAIGGWHSTGLWAPPGQKITLTLQGKSKAPMSLRIGSQSDFLTWNHLEKHHDGKLRRLPRLTNSVRISGDDIRGRKFEFANPVGGLIYIEVHGVHKKVKPAKMTVSGGVPAPLYIFGDKPLEKEYLTTSEEWKTQLAEYKAPWGEIQTPRLTFTLPLDMLQMMKLPRRVCKKLQSGMAVQDWLVGWDLDENRINEPMRFVIDRQISVGYGHSGYPAMGYMDWGNCIKSGDLTKSGSWGLWHELGHNHQGPTPYFCIPSANLTEVTVNVFSTISQVHGCDVDYAKAWDGTSIAEDDMRESVAAFFRSAEKFSPFEDVRVKLYFYVELMRELGYEAFRAMAMEYHKKPFGNISDQEKWDWILTTLSEATEKNLAPYFKAWKIDVSSRALNKVEKYPDWEYLKDYPEKYLNPKPKRERKEKPEGAPQSGKTEKTSKSAKAEKTAKGGKSPKPEPSPKPKKEKSAPKK